MRYEPKNVAWIALRADSAFKSALLCNTTTLIIYEKQLSLFNVVKLWNWLWWISQVMNITCDEYHRWWISSQSGFSLSRILGAVGRPDVGGPWHWRSFAQVLNGTQPQNWTFQNLYCVKREGRAKRSLSFWIFRRRTEVWHRRKRSAFESLICDLKYSKI